VELVPPQQPLKLKRINVRDGVPERNAHVLGHIVAARARARSARLYAHHLPRTHTHINSGVAPVRLLCCRARRTPPP
jgi:hypothetical protein